MFSLKDVVEEYALKGKLVTVKRHLSVEFEPTVELIRAERLGKAVFFNVASASMGCVGNIIFGRGALYDFMGVKCDEEAYLKILKVLSAGVVRASLSSEDEIFRRSFTVKEFSNFYKPYMGGLDELPAIKFYELDGGRYVTSSIVVARTPDVVGFNASVHRLMLVPGVGFAIRVVPRHLYRVITLNRKARKPTPIAIAIGVHPLVLLAASTSPAYGVFELEGFKELSGSPLCISLTPKYAIPVPSLSSVIIEGAVTLKDVDEGPFVDLLGLYDAVRSQPLIKVEAIYVSNDDIPFHVILPGGIEHRLLMGIPREALIWRTVSEVIPRVAKVRLTDGGGGWLHAVIAIDKQSEGDGKSAIMAAFAGHPSLKHVVVVDSDIDPGNPIEVEWALATRFQAGRGLVVVRHARGSTLDPSSFNGVTDKVGIDATAPIRDRSKYVRPRVPGKEV